MRAHAEAQRANGVRDIRAILESENGSFVAERQANEGGTAGEIKVKNFDQDMKTKGSYLDPDTGNFYVKQPDGGIKKFTKDENGNDVIIVSDKDGKIQDFREIGVDVTDVLDLAKKPIQETKIELVQATNIVAENANFKGQGGNENASNAKGSGQFNYQPFQQILHKFGMECRVGSGMHVLMSLGLVPPNADKKALEKALTHLDSATDLPKKYFDDVKDLKVKDKVFPDNLTRSLRGFPNYTNDIKDKDGKIIKKGKLIELKDKLKPEDFRDAANKLAKNSEYAKQTGMENKKFEVKRFKTKEEVYKHVENGGIARVYTTQYRGGHYIVIKGIERNSQGSVEKIYTDDNLYPNYYKHLNTTK